jgi:iron-sulfur cluster insertion protein
MITITETVDNKILELIQDNPDAAPNTALRIFVQGGGCSGMQYGFTFDSELNEDDFEINQNGVRYLVDAMSMQYLSGAEIDYKEDFEGSSFVVKNPNAQTSCGCGSSFSV